MAVEKCGDVRIRTQVQKTNLGHPSHWFWSEQWMKVTISGPPVLGRRRNQNYLGALRFAHPSEIQNGSHAQANDDEYLQYHKDPKPRVKGLSKDLGKGEGNCPM
jgi:hypothetical protein